MVSTRPSTNVHSRSKSALITPTTSADIHRFQAVLAAKLLSKRGQARRTGAVVDVLESLCLMSSAEGANHHNRLRSALQALVEAACQRLAGQSMPMAFTTVMRYTADRSGRGEQRITPSPGGLVNALQQEWTLWGAFQDLRDATDADFVASAYLLSDALGHSVNADNGWLLGMVAARFVHDYFITMRGPQIAFQEEAFERLWKEFSQTIDTGLGNVVWWAPIYNAEWIGEPFEIALNATNAVVEPSPEVMFQLAAHRRHSNMIEAQAWLKTTDSVALKAPPIAEPPIKNARQVAAAIRLIAGGHAFARDITMLPCPGVPGGYGQFAGWRGFPPAWWGGVASVLDRSIQTALQDRFGQLQKLGESFDVVLDRYESAVTKLIADERLIDATIGLEALLLGGSGSSIEVTFRFALIGAWLLAEKPADRVEMKRLLTELYRKRSDIVHGNRKRKRELPPNPEDLAVDLLRNLLLQVLDSGRSWEEWIKYRSKLILGLTEREDGQAPEEHT
jgi:Apea-like HEPN